jgi:hypothetical protein
MSFNPVSMRLSCVAHQVGNSTNCLTGNVLQPGVRFAAAESPNKRKGQQRSTATLHQLAEVSLNQRNFYLFLWGGQQPQECKEFNPLKTKLICFI